MTMRFLSFISIVILISIIPNNSYAATLYTGHDSSTFILNKYQAEDAIIGKWITVQKNLEVEVSKVDGIFQAKIIWFKEDDKSKPMNSILDEKNPNPALRSRKWLGMEVLRNLTYNAEDNKWEHGIIYDAKHGREWDSVVWINKDGLLKVKGYWLFQWISETLTFEKATN
ncbi:MAG TPA: DUF2147 domain-containing protein [Hanamia sp.]